MLIKRYNTDRFEIIEKNTSPFVNISISDDGLVIDQQYFGSGNPIYYTKYKNTLFICDSLQTLKTYAGFRYELNTDMLPHFFYNGFICGTHTLIKGVSKLPLCKRIIIGKNDVIFDNWDNKKDWLYYFTNQDAMELQYDQCMQDVFGDLRLRDIPVSLALSGGFDSNCLLHYMKTMYPEKELLTVCIGGIKGIDERAIARSIAMSYKGVRFVESVVTSETLEHLDHIVRCLEGCVYERGIFLQYELARKLQQESASNILCGECADQVFHSGSYRNHRDCFLYDYRNTPREMAAYVVLPKSYLMLRAFGIQGYYPFLDPRIVSIGKATTQVNGVEKRFHKSFCEHQLSKTVFSKLEKVGGSTSLVTLWKSYSSTALENSIMDSKYYDSNFRLTEKYSYDESLMDYWLSLKYIESFERQFCDGVI